MKAMRLVPAALVAVIVIMRRGSPRPFDVAAMSAIGWLTTGGSVLQETSDGERDLARNT